MARACVYNYILQIQFTTVHQCFKQSYIVVTHAKLVYVKGVTQIKEVKGLMGFLNFYFSKWAKLILSTYTVHHSVP